MHAPSGDAGAAASLAVAEGRSLDALAIGAARVQAWADVVLSGAVTPAQLDSNLASSDAAHWTQHRNKVEQAARRAAGLEPH